MSAALSTQEMLFLDRLAQYMARGGEINEESIRAAGEQVLADDRRLVGMIFKNDGLRRDASRALCSSTYKQIRREA